MKENNNSFFAFLFKDICRKSLLFLLCVLCITACGGGEGDGSTSASRNEGVESEEVSKMGEDMELKRNELLAQTEIEFTSYDVDEIVSAEDTAVGSFEKWKKEIVLVDPQNIENVINNDNPTQNSVIHSPFHTLTVNGKAVPVYTVRCTKGVHSFAWIDVKNNNDFCLAVELELGFNAKKCVVLPESRGVDATVINYRKVTADIYNFGSYTFTFSPNTRTKVTDPALAPITLMVTEEEPLSVPEGYGVFEVEPGYHDNSELEFKNSNTVYVMKSGFHDISSIGLPSDSILYIERGAYIKVNDRLEEDGHHNRETAIHTDDAQNVKIISRGLLDCGAIQGGDNKYKHVVIISRSKNVLISGLTVINSNTWTMSSFSSENVCVEKNLLLGYRTYSDGIMMSECINSVGRYNFVRTGDDAMEFKGTGWNKGDIVKGEGCVYEYNDIWTDKGAGYCLTWESSCSMSNMVFRNNAVGFALPEWTSRNTAIDCLLGTDASSVWENVLFENIEIYYVNSPNAINMQIQGDGGNLNNIVFRNIDVYSAKDGVYPFRMHFSANGGSIGDVLIDNYVFCEKKISKEDISNPTVFRNEAGDYINNITVE